MMIGLVDKFKEYYEWGIDDHTGFRVIKFIYKVEFSTELDKFENWSGAYRVCSKCRETLPLSYYFFNSGGVGKYHRYCKICEGAPNFGWGRNKQSELNSCGLHYCRKCDRILALNQFYFSTSSGRCNKTGFTSNCKECNGTESFGLHSLNSHSDILGIKNGFKLCHNCLIEYPDDEKYFFKKKDRKFGSTHCKVCRGSSYGVYMPNVVYADEIPKGHQMCIDCGILISDSLANSRCSTCYKEYNKIQNNSPKAIEYRREYYKKTSTMRRVREIGQNRRSMKANTISDLTLAQYDETLTYFNNACSYCGLLEDEHITTYSENMHQDHIVPLSNLGGYTKNNIIPACKSCNCSKNNKSLSEYYEYADDFPKDRYKKILRFVIKNSDFNNSQEQNKYLLKNRLISDGNLDVFL